MFDLSKFTRNDDYIISCECTQCGCTFEEEEVLDGCPNCNEDTEIINEWANEGRVCSECGLTIDCGTDCYIDDEDHTLCEDCYKKLSEDC